MLSANSDIAAASNRKSISITRTVAIVADDEVRFERILQRGRSEDGDRAAFEARNAREIGWGLDRLIANADHVLDNNQPLQSFKAACVAWMAEHF